MAQCSLWILVTAREPPIQCRRRVWEADLRSGVCYSCHPRGREKSVERIVKQVLDRERGLDRRDMQPKWMPFDSR